MASYSQPESGQIIYVRSDFPHPFSKEGMGHTVQNWPGSDLDGLARVWLNSSGLKASWCQESFGPVSGSMQLARFRSSKDIPDNSIQNQPGSDLVLADCARFLAKQIWSGSKPMCENHPACIWPTLPRRSSLDANRIRHVYWDATEMTTIIFITQTRWGKSWHTLPSAFLFSLKTDSSSCSSSAVHTWVDLPRTKSNAYNHRIFWGCTGVEFTYLVFIRMPGELP